jgi:anti-sigma regulatory factor (Ser/Thr protein kinase)
VINAGIPYGILHRKALQRTDTIPLDGAPLGLFDLPRVSEKVGVLEPGDRLLFATDGLLDLVSMTGISYRELAPPKWQELSATPVPSALSAIYEAAKTHGQGRINDDILAIAMEQPEWLPKGTELIRVVPSNLDAIEHLCEEFKTFLQDQPLTRNLNKIRRFEVLLALREALSNAHRHGNRRDSRERIALHASLEAHSLLVRVVDGGQGFEIKTQQQEPDTASEGGRGITILQSMTSSLRMHAGELEFRIGFIGAADGREN